MNDFPKFMKNPVNKINSNNLYTPGIEGYVFDGADGSQITIWNCSIEADSESHVHDFDEYVLVVEGKYTININGKEINLGPGDEYLVPKGTVHGGRCYPGSRTINSFGGHRADRES